MAKKNEEKTIENKSMPTELGYTLDDGKVESSNGVVMVLTPVDLTVIGSSYAIVRAGVTFDMPVMVFPPASWEKRGLKFLGGAKLLNAGQPLELVVTNRAPAAKELVQEGEPLARVVPIGAFVLKRL